VWLKVNTYDGQIKLVFTQKCVCIEISHLCSGCLFVKSKRWDKCISFVEVWPQISARDRNEEFVLTRFCNVKNCLSFFLGFFFWCSDLITGAHCFSSLQRVSACFPVFRTAWQSPSQTFNVINLKVFPAQEVFKHPGMSKHWGWKMRCS